MMLIVSVLLLFSLISVSVSHGPMAAEDGIHQEEAQQRRRGHQHTCVHGKVATRPQSVELDLVNVNIRDKRAASVYQGIRIKSHVLMDSINLSLEVMGFLVTALNAASQYLEQAILVEPLQVNLRFRPSCTISSDNSSKCDCGVGTNSTLYCGPHVTIPAEHVGMAAVQSNMTCGLNGTGVENADTVIYVTAISDATCAGKPFPMVFGSACLTDPQLQDRPVAGYLNFCPNNVNRNALYQEEFMQRILIHELLHILGMSDELFHLFKTQKSGSTTIVKEEKYASSSVPAIATANVTDIGKRHFSCPDLVGVHYAGNGHWPMRTMMTEIMTSDIYPAYSILSEFTLALLEDSGWYQANYTVANSTTDGRSIPFLFGKGLKWGCRFLRQSCSLQPPHERWHPYICTPRRNAFGPTTCSFDGQHKADCVEFADILGTLCYYPVPATDYWDCTSEANNSVYHRELEVFSQNSLCFMSVLGGGTDIYPFSTQDPPVLGEGPPAILGESQLFRQFLLPHCYAVRAFGYGDEYKYEIVPGGDDYSDLVCTRSNQKIILGCDSVECHRQKDIVEQLRPSSLISNASIITSLTLSTASRNLSTGDTLILVCQPDIPLKLMANIEYHVVWKLNGSRVSIKHHATYMGHKHFLIAVAPTSNHSGVFSCALQENETVSSSVEITVQPGCLPRAFVPATPIGEQHVVDCSRAHPSLRGVMRWTCVSNLTWDGDLSGCAFTGSAVNSLVLVSYLICAGTSEVRLGLEMIQEHILQELQLDGVPVIGLSSVDIRRFGYNLTLAVFTGESRNRGAANLSKIYDVGEDGFLVGGLIAVLARDNFQTPFLVPSNVCTCLPPGMAYDNSAELELCKAPFPPCCCSEETNQCECLDPFVFVNTSSDPQVKCSLDSDGDGIPDHLDAEPFVYDPSLKPRDENCQTTVVQSCPVETTSSPDISWSETAPCVYDVQRCCKLLNETVGLAYRLCNSSGQWEKPDVRGCQSVTLRDLEKKGQVLSMPDIILRSPAHTCMDGLLPGDITIVITAVSRILDANPSNISDSLAMNLLQVMSNLLDGQNDESWTHLNTDTDCASETLLSVTERLSLTIAQNVVPDKNFTYKPENTNIAVFAQALSLDLINETTVVNIFLPEASILIQSGVLRTRVEKERTFIVIATIKRLGMFLPRQFVNESSLPSGKDPSVIVSLQVGNTEMPQTSVDQNPVELTFTNNDFECAGQTQCVFWNYTDEKSIQNRSLGGWSEEGVSTLNQLETSSVTCSVRHLTSFAVLVDVTGQSPTYTTLAYRVVSYIGCAISLLCLIATIIFLVTLRRELFKKLNNFVHLNLCIALACGLLIFLAGIEGAKGVPIACKIVAFLLHYFFLAAFFWMLCEAVMMYNLLVRVFHANERKWVYIYLALGWVPPLFIAVISIAVRHENYLIEADNNCPTGPKRIIACWLSTDLGTIFAFVAPMLAILIVNAVLAVFVMVSLCKHLGRRKKYHVKRKADVTLVWDLFKAFIIILPLLGFTWIIGLFAVNEDTAVFAWLFTCVNSLQGAAIFFFYVLRHEKVRPKILQFSQCFKKKMAEETPSPSTARQYPPGTVDTIETTSVVKASSFPNESKMDLISTAANQADSAEDCKLAAKEDPM